jgi:hypothetical protein
MTLHPQVVHLPIALAVLMPLVSLGLFAAWLSGYLPRRTWLIALVLQAILVGSAFAALRTGEDDEEIGEKYAGKHDVHEHEEAGELFFFVSIGVLVAVGAAHFVRQEKPARIIAAVAVAGTIAVLVLGYRTGQAGGHIIHDHLGDGIVERD